MTSTSGAPSHSATLINPKFAGLLLPEHSSRCAPIARAARDTSSSGKAAARCEESGRLDRPWLAA